LISRLPVLHGTGYIMMLARMRRILVAVLVLAGCGGGRVKEPAFPASMAPGWTRGAVRAMDAAQFPPLIREAGIKQGWETEYRAADGAVARVDAWGLKASAQGLDLVQKWRPVRDHAQFYTEHYLLDVGWEKAGRDELAVLVRGLPKMVEGE
jgi:hypothetical protein